MKDLFIVSILISFTFLIPLATADVFGNVGVNYLLPGLNCNRSSILISKQQGQTATELIGVLDSNSSYPVYDANFSASGNANFINDTTFNPNPVLVNNTTANTTIATIAVPSSQTPGIYIGYIFANSTRGNCTISLAVIVTAPPTPPEPPTGGIGGGGGAVPFVLDTDVEIESGSDQVVPGQRVYASITILKIGGPGTPVNVNLTYVIRDPEGKTVDFKMTTVGVETLRRDIYFLTLPPDAPLGVYTFRALASYGREQDTADATFQVVKTLPAALLDVRRVNVPLMFTGQSSGVTLVLENNGEDDINLTVTAFFPEGFDPKQPSENRTIEGGSEEIFVLETTPWVFGLFDGFISLKYDGKGMTREFSILVLPFYILLIPLIIFILIFIIWRKKKRGRRYIRGERITHIRRMVGK